MVPSCGDLEPDFDLPLSFGCNLALWVARALADTQVAIYCVLGYVRDRHRVTGNGGRVRWVMCWRLSSGAPTQPEDRGPMEVS